MNHSYELEHYTTSKSRFNCPQCNKKGEFTRYIDPDGEYLSDDVGICNRKEKCGYHYPPKEYFSNNPFHNINYKKVFTQEPEKTPDFIPIEKVKESLPLFRETEFYNGLVKYYPVEKVQAVANLYRLGGKDGKVVFPEIDTNYKVRTCRITAYTGNKRNHDIHDGWMHNYIDKPNFSLVQVPFGMHLLRQYPYKDIAVVEACKTAVIASIEMPETNWLAVGTLNSIGLIQGIDKRLMIYPDKGSAFRTWKENIPRMNVPNFRIMTFLENTNYPEGADLADYLLDLVTLEYEG